MDFKLVSKNNLGAVTALILVIILSQSRFFNFLLDTALGRAILILFVLFISYTNKILGVVSVLFIIIMFNTSNVGYMEGFDATTMGSSMKYNSKTAGPAGVTGTPGAEGHNLNGLEDTMKKGVKSNSIPVTKSESKENFEPFSGTFKEPYSAF